MTKTRLFATQALLPAGWADDVLFEIDGRGDLLRVEPGHSGEGAKGLTGPVIPGMANLHSHAFQRAMAGLAERAGPGDDSFWTWREVMYGFVASLTPEQVEAIAAQLYVEMLKSGYTAVGEFHYLHHGPDGEPYDDLAEMSRRRMCSKIPKLRLALEGRVQEHHRYLLASSVNGALGVCDRTDCRTRQID